jgi:hypothetical protein
MKAKTRMIRYFKPQLTKKQFLEFVDQLGKPFCLKDLEQLKAPQEDKLKFYKRMRNHIYRLIADGKLVKDEKLSRLGPGKMAYYRKKLDIEAHKQQELPANISALEIGNAVIETLDSLRQQLQKKDDEIRQLKKINNVAGQRRIQDLKKKINGLQDKLCQNERRIKVLTDLLHRSTGKTIKLSSLGL